MFIAISGLHGTGKSSIAKYIAEKFHLKYYSTGQMFRELAERKGLTLEELSKKAEEDASIDNELDETIRQHVIEGDCVLESQLSAFLFGDLADYCVLLKCAKDVRLKRMALRDGNDIDKKVEETMIREESERKRFLEYYGIDILDTNLIMGTFDLIVDTTYIDEEGVKRIVEMAIKEYLRSKKG
ncbi:MAG: (d)CMP kinase [Promethearchaeota archaeon]